MKNPLENLNNTVKNILAKYDLNSILQTPEFGIKKDEIYNNVKEDDKSNFESNLEYNNEDQIYNNLIQAIKNENLETQVPIIFEDDESDSPFNFFKTTKKNIQPIIKSSQTKINKKKNSQVIKFIEENYNAAKELSEKYGYPIEFILGVGRNESGNGKNPAYKTHNVMYNIKALANQSGIQQRDTDKHKNSYIATYKTYNSKKESMEDFVKWCVRHNIKGNTIEELAFSFAQSPFAEGWGKTTEEANQNLFNNYVNIIKDTQRYIYK